MKLNLYRQSPIQKAETFDEKKKQNKTNLLNYLYMRTYTYIYVKQ